MKHLKLKHAMSYAGHGVRVSKKAPDVFVDDQVAAALLATGYFEDADGQPTTSPPVTPTGTVEAIDTMSVTKLRAYAKEKGLDLTWPTGTDADTIRADIKAALDKTEDENPANQFTGGQE